MVYVSSPIKALASSQVGLTRKGKSLRPRLAIPVFYRFLVPAPNCKFNVDANTGHGFAIFMASVGALRPAGSGAS